MMVGRAAPSLQKNTLICLLSILWNCSLVQSTINTSSVISNNNDDEPSYQDWNFEFSADHQLIPFQEQCIAHVMYSIRDGGGRETELRCTLGNGLSYLVPSVDESWISEQMILGELISAETVMILSADAMLNQHTHEIHTTELPKLWNYEMQERERRRKLRRLATTGTKTVLVVRVEASDASTTPTPTQLGNHVFGDDGNDYNFKYQTEACSHNQLIIEKARDRRGRAARVSNGVVTVSVNLPATSGELPMQNAITWALNTEFGINRPSVLADHVMYCFPVGTTSKLAYGEVGGYLSFYNDEACTYPSAALHEIGHNYNMGHSADSDNEYGDKSGAMGYVYWYTYQPKMCFNAAKSWQLGWYASKAESISPSAANPTYSIKLSGVVDYSTTDHKVLLEIQQSSTTTYYYVNFNRAKGINSGTQEGVNQVLIVSKDTSVESNISMSLASLDRGQSYTISNFNGNSGETLTITVPLLNRNEATVDIVLSGFAVDSSSPSVSPSLTPSKAPSNLPSMAPSILPSSKPSVHGSNKPSVMPSLAPSKLPSTVPSNKPSVITIDFQSQRPSGTPSKQPSSKEPSNRPSVVPSKQPVGRPLNVPSINPKVTSSQSQTPSSAPSYSTNIAVLDNPTGFRNENYLEPTSAAPSKPPSLAPSSSPTNAPNMLFRIGDSIILNLSAQQQQEQSGGLGGSQQIPVQRTATVVIDIGLGDTTYLESICNGIESYLAQTIQSSFAGTNTQTTVECTQSESVRRTRRALNQFLAYEKPTYVRVTTAFSDFRQAPREIGYGNFLEELIESEDSQKQLPVYIQQSLKISGSNTEEGVYVRVIETDNKPMLVVGFGQEPPTLSPTLPPTTGRGSGSDDGMQGTYQASAGHSTAEHLLPLMMTTLAVCIFEFM